MIASFKKLWNNNEATFFVGKIWSAYLHYNLVENANQAYLEYVNSYAKKFPNQILDDKYENCYEVFGEFGLNIDEPKDLKPKLHTIRAGSRWRAEMKIHFGINPRSKNYFQFAPVIPCVSVQEIEIRHKLIGAFIEKVYVFIDGIKIHEEKIKILARNDGFENVDDFFKFFHQDFTGQIVHWTDRKY
ncbi:hypothetical protein V9L05_01420 [Bernardetia sp. Wsw4-3y2]|uniref:hypothetical protein n=1 Tax=Bernardetia sp. Wsw4-3y2 TaxID=3127471 RepID=UPI0030D09AAA